MDIIDRGLKTIDLRDLRVILQAAFCPFDRPSLIQKAVNQVSPQVVVLLETEIWPGLLARVKQARIPVLIVNGRITVRSLNRYRIWSRLWRRLRPEKILAISEEDAARFAILFGYPNVSVMNNIKFDRLKLADDPSHADDGFRRLLLPGQPFAVLGSIRQQEEDQVAGMIATILAEVPGTVIGLFPRHLSRLSFWRSTLAKMNVAWTLRSEWHQPIESGGVILWDTFGELGRAYSNARAAFVGGSLAPLGGQNFLEPMICGVRPVIGPYWDNFRWVGKTVFQQNLVRTAPNGKAVSEILIADLADPVDRKEMGKAARKYIEQHQGGTEQACRVIRGYLYRSSF
jgi:3-deoxy-D-manno-octulosonic-acid transferase